MNIHYSTNPMKLGNHEWRCLVVGFYRGGRCTKYQWRKPACTIGDYTQPAGRWKNAQDWPSFNSDDTYHGLPKSIDRLYKKHEAEIKAHLDGMTLF